jgi:hypothetical protein
MIDAARIKELREWLARTRYTLIDGRHWHYRHDEAGFTDLLAILDDYERLRAENERLNRQAAIAPEGLILATMANLSSLLEAYEKQIAEAKP